MTGLTVVELVLLGIAALCFGATMVGIPSGKSTNLLGGGAFFVTLALIFHWWPPTT